MLVSYGRNLQKVQTVSATEPDPLAEVQQLLFLSQGGRHEQAQKWARSAAISKKNESQGRLLEARQQVVRALSSTATGASSVQWAVRVHFFQ